jgi:hypothetical protein
VDTSTKKPPIRKYRPRFEPSTPSGIEKYAQMMDPDKQSSYDRKLTSVNQEEPKDTPDRRIGTCCYVDTSTEGSPIPCNMSAKWWIQEQGAKYDDYTESCTAHVHEFLCGDTTYIIAPSK